MRKSLLMLFIFLGTGIFCVPRKTTKVVVPEKEYTLYEIEEGEKKDTLVTREITPEETIKTPPKTTLGYRVQIFASATQEGAERVAAEARFKFTEPVYVEYEPHPFAPYKVRVGDFLNKSDAEVLRNRARMMGYSDAWIVQTEVNVP